MAEPIGPAQTRQPGSPAISGLGTADPGLRPGILSAQDRLSVARDGSIVYRFRKPWRNGKLAVVMDAMTFLSRLAAQIPPPRCHVLSYFGVLAAAASRRDEIVPGDDVDDGVCS